MERDADYNNVNNNAADNNNNNNNVDDVPLAMHSHLLRMLYELRVPIWMRQGGGGAAGAAGAYDDYVDNAMEQADAAAVLAGSLYDVRPVKHVVDIADGETGEKHGIREMAYNKEIAEEMKINTACGIWQEEFEHDQAIKILPCNHAFDAEAITKWLTTEKAECPMCRFKLESKEVIVRPPAGDDNDMPALVSDDDDVIDDMPEPHHPQPNPPVDEQRARENNIMYRLNNIIYNRAHGGGAADMGRDHHYGVSMPMNRLLQMRAGLVHGARAGGAAVAAGVGGSQPPQLSQNHQHHVVTNINYNYYVNPINRYMFSVEGQEQLDIEEAIRRSLEE
jgi:hypothetical protein